MLAKHAGHALAVGITDTEVVGSGREWSASGDLEPVETLAADAFQVDLAVLDQSDVGGQRVDCDVARRR